MTPKSRLTAHAIVSQSAFASSDPYALISANIRFVNQVIHKHQVVPEHMQPEALMSYYLDFYIGQVSNGGHEQFVRNMAASSKVPWRRSQRTLEPIAAALARLDVPRTAAVFKMVRDRLDKDQALLIGARNRGGFHDEYFGKVDKWMTDADRQHYEAVKTEKVLEKNSAFVRSWPALVVVPDEEVDAAIAKLIADDPSRALMEAEHKPFAAELAAEPVRRRERLSQIISESLRISVASDAEERVFDFKSFPRRRGTFDMHTAYAVITADGLIAAVLDGRKLYLLDLDQSTGSWRERAKRSATPEDRQLFAV